MRHVLLIAGALFAATPAHAEPPMSFQMFCAVNTAECRADAPATVVLTDTLLEVLRDTNRRVNRTIRPKLDDAALQVWRVNPTSGDCKSYVVSKRHALAKAGIPAGALRIGVGTVGSVLHAVLIIKTDAGDLVLDNMTNAIKPLPQAAIRLTALSGANPLIWSEL